jgi:phosphonate transport system substrate-binding protein
VKYSIYFPLLCIYLVVSILAYPVSTQAAQESQMRFFIGYSANSLPEVDIKDAAAALEVWVKELAKGVGVSAESRIYNDSYSLIKDFQNGKVDMGVMRSLDYLNAERELNSELALAKVRGGKTTTKILLLVSSDSGFSDIKDLKNKNIAMLKGDDLGDIFLDSTLLQKKLPYAKHFFKSIQEKNKPSSVILPVFFNQIDACITTDTSFETMIRLNPQLGNKLKVIASSPELISSVSFFRKDYNEKYKQKALNTSQTLNNNPRGQQVLLLFQGDKLVKMQKSDLDSTRNFYNNFKKLMAEN